MSTEGVLYIVATPIGNLEDITLRALHVLKSVDLIAAEDTRHSRKLMQHYGIETRLHTYHDHSTSEAVTSLLERLCSGQDVALISDAGTPLISDPGYRIVNEARMRAIRVVPIPGVSAPITALCAAGLPTDHFSFEGFLPAKRSARRKALAELVKLTHTLIFFESPHRIQETLADMAELFGSERTIVLARELTKTFETFLDGPIQDIQQQLELDANQCRGEMVLMVKGADTKPKNAELDEHSEHLLATLLEDLPTKQASTIAAKLTGVSKKILYQHAVMLKDS